MFYKIQLLYGTKKSCQNLTGLPGKRLQWLRDIPNVDT